jgi:hypothetical protein
VNRAKESESWPYRLRALDQGLEDCEDRVCSIAGDDEVPDRHRLTLAFVAKKLRYLQKIVRKATPQGFEGLD